MSERPPHQPTGHARVDEFICLWAIAERAAEYVRTGSEEARAALVRALRESGRPVVLPMPLRWAARETWRASGRPDPIRTTR